MFVEMEEMSEAERGLKIRVLEMLIKLNEEHHKSANSELEMLILKWEGSDLENDDDELEKLYEMPWEIQKRTRKFLWKKSRENEEELGVINVRLNAELKEVKRSGEGFDQYGRRPDSKEYIK
jgi:hypothetical protein